MSDECIGQAHYAMAGWKGWFRYFFWPDTYQSSWRYWKPACLTWYGWRESWRFWTGAYNKGKWGEWRRAYRRRQS